MLYLLPILCTCCRPVVHMLATCCTQVGHHLPNLLFTLCPPPVHLLFAVRHIAVSLFCTVCPPVIQFLCMPNFTFHMLPTFQMSCPPVAHTLTIFVHLLHILMSTVCKHVARLVPTVCHPFVKVSYTCCHPVVRLVAHRLYICCLHIRDLFSTWYPPLVHLLWSTLCPQFVDNCFWVAQFLFSTCCKHGHNLPMLPTPLVDVRSKP